MRFRWRCFSSKAAPTEHSLDPLLLVHGEREMLQVELIGARELRARMFPMVNPYCKLTLGGTMYKSPSRKMTQDPIWGTFYVFDFSSPADVLRLEVWDDQIFGKDALIGTALTTVEEIVKEQKAAQEFGNKDFETFFHLVYEEKKEEGVFKRMRDFSSRSRQVEESGEKIVPWEKKSLKVADPEPEKVLSWEKKPSSWIQSVSERSRKLGKEAADGIWASFLNFDQSQKMEQRGRIYVKFRVAKAKDLVATLPKVVPPAKIPPAEVRQKGVRSVWADESSAKKRMFRIISLDGGGVRGVLSAGILRRLVKNSRFPTLLDDADLICGTSTGGLLAMLFASGYTPAQAQSLYAYHCPQIFETNPTRRYSPFAAKYTNTHLHKVMQDYFEDLKLSELSRPVMVTSFRIRDEPSHSGPKAGWRPALFSNVSQFHDDVGPPSVLCSDVACRISAAPTFFPAYQNYVDGAIFANNPALCAIVRVMQGPYCRVNLERVCVLSIGSGKFFHNIPTDKEGENFQDWGLRQWAPYLRDILLDSSALSLDSNMSSMLGERYMRVNPSLSGVFGLDDVSSIGEMFSASSKMDLKPVEEFISRVWYSDVA